MFGGFGNTAAAPATPFGAQPAAGAAPATGGLFGNTAAAAPAATGGGLFGGSSTAQPTAGGGFFGSTQAAQPATGGLFGSTPATSQPAVTGGLFGSTQPAAGGTSLFGGTSQPAVGGGLFGGASTTQPAAGGGLFGAASTAQPAAGGGLFGGASASTGFFGANASTAAKPLFGATATPATAGAFSLTQPASLMPPSAPPTQANALLTELNKIKTAYDDDPSNPNYRFKFVFYSAIREELLASLGPDRVLQDVLTEEPNWDDETRQLWNQTKAANPDKHRFIPDVVRGVSIPERPDDGLQGRVSKQRARTQELKSCLEMMEKELTAIEDEHVLMRERVVQCKRAQVAMAQNVVEAVALLESRRIRDRPMTQGEEQMLATLDKIKRELASPAQYSARLLELQSKARSLQQSARTVSYSKVELDPDDVELVKKFMQQQQEALDVLSCLVADDIEDMQIMANELAKGFY